MLLNGSISSGTAQTGSAATAAVANLSVLGLTAGRRLVLAIDGVTLTQVITVSPRVDPLAAQLNLVTEFASKAIASVVAGKLLVTSKTTGAGSSVAVVYYEGPGTVTTARGTDAKPDYEVARAATGLQF